MVFLLLAGAASMDILPHALSGIGGGAIAYIVMELRKAFTTYIKNKEHTAVLEDGKEKRDADDSRSFATEAHAERRETLRKVEAQAEEITRLSVEIAKCTAKHELNELRDAEKDAQLKHLNLSLEMTQQLVTKQREEIDAQERVIEAQGREIIDMHTQTAGLKSEFSALKEQFDELVKRTMGVRSISEIPGPG